MYMYMYNRFWISKIIIKKKNLKKYHTNISYKEKKEKNSTQKNSTFLNSECFSMYAPFSLSYICIYILKRNHGTLSSIIYKILSSSLLSISPFADSWDQKIGFPPHLNAQHLVIPGTLLFFKK